MVMFEGAFLQPLGSGFSMPVVYLDLFNLFKL